MTPLRNISSEGAGSSQRVSRRIYKRARNSSRTHSSESSLSSESRTRKICNKSLANNLDRGNNLDRNNNLKRRDNLDNAPITKCEMEKMLFNQKLYIDNVMSQKQDGPKVWVR